MTPSENDAIAVERRGEVNFSKPLPRALLRDGRLSFAARGLFAFLWDLPAGWKPKMKHLEKMSGAKRTALGRMIAELKKYGALTIEPIKLDAAEAADLNRKVAAGELSAPRRPWRSGMVRGSRWVLFSAEGWAVETPLTPGVHRDADFPNLGEVRGSGNQLQGVNDVDGSSISKTTTKVAVVFSDGSTLEGVASEVAVALKFFTEKKKNITEDRASYAVGIINKSTPEALLAQYRATIAKAAATEALRNAPPPRMAEDVPDDKRAAGKQYTDEERRKFFKK